MNKQVLEILAQATKLSLEDQRLLNRMLCDNMKRVQKVEGAKVAMTFNIGDKVIFDARTKGIIKMEINGFSRDGSKIKGIQLGGIRPGCMWQVASTLCKAA